MSADGLLSAVQETLADLLEATRASRVTLRIDRPELGWHVDEPAAEALAPGVKSIRGTPGLDQRSLPTVRHIDRTRRILVQEDCDGADPAPPAALIEIYGVRAQMLAPLVEHGELNGWVSVHDTAGARDWQGSDVDALSKAAQALASALRETQLTERQT
jgi:maleate isomerase